MARFGAKLESLFVGPDDTLLLYLPLAHNYGRLIHLQAIHVGYTLAFFRDPLRGGDALAAGPPPAPPHHGPAHPPAADPRRLPPRVLPRPAPGRRRPTRSPPDDVPERPARL